MGLIGDIADKASGLLGGGPSAPAGMVSETPKYKQGEPIEQTGTDAGGATALEHPNIFDPGRPTEFVHFGTAHRDVHDRFPHGALADDKEGIDFGSVAGSHAIMFRAALEREAILMSQFMTSLKDLMAEAKAKQGGMNQMIGAAQSLMGGNATPGPDPGAVEPYIAAVGAAGSKVNVASIQYKDIHQAGLDLHQARANWNKYAPTSNQAGAGGEGLFGNLPSVIPAGVTSAMGPVSDIISTITGILFKMFEVYHVMLLKSREKWEPPIEQACHLRSLKAIRARQLPVFDVWSVTQAQIAAAGAPGPNILNITTGIKPADDAVGDVNRQIDEWRQAWEDFWTTDPLPGPGEAELDAVFAAITDSEEIFAQAFRDALKIGEVPGFIKTVLSKVCGVNVGILKAIYKKLQDPATASQLTLESLLGAGHAFLRGTLVSTVSDVLPNLSLPGPTGAITKDMILKKGVAFLDEEIGKEIDPVLNLVMMSVAEVILPDCQKAIANKQYTMEVFLGRLPMLVALMTRNTVFPVFQILADKVFGEMGGFGDMAASPIKNMMNDARGSVADMRQRSERMNQNIQNEANSMANDVAAAEKGLQQDINKYTGGVGNLNTPVGGAAQGLAGAVGGAVDSVLGAAGGGAGGPAAAGPAFPGSARLTSGTGVEIKQSEWNEVKPKLVFPSE